MDNGLISGGSCNTVSAYCGTIGGGCCNTVSGGGSTISGGILNCVCNSGGSSAIGGGANNIVSGTYSTIGGGCNKITSSCSTIGGGCNNTVCSGNSTISGGVLNCVCNNASSSSISGGWTNTVSGAYSVLGGGRTNTISGNYATLGGGRSNLASGDYSGILGGCCNDTKGVSNTFILGSNLSATQADFTYVNNISSKGLVYDATGNSTKWNNTYTTVNSNSAAWSLIVNNDSHSPGYYGSFYDTSTQTLTGVNQAKRLDIANTFEANGISLSGNKIVFNNIGTYELIFSIQYKNISQNQEDIYIWYRKNGVDIPYSSSVFTIPARKSAGIPAHLIAVTPFIATLAASDFIEIYWHCNNTEVTVETFTTHNNPTIPDTPGVIITATQVAVLSSFGNVTGPVSAVNNSIARFNGTTGKIITDGVNSTIDNNGNAVFAGTLSANGAITTTQYVNISSTTFTGLTATATTSLTALNTFLQVIVNGSTKYLRLFDII